MTTPGEIAMVMDLSMLMYLVLVENICYAAAAAAAPVEQVLRLAIANTFTDMLLMHIYHT